MAEKCKREPEDSFPDISSVTHSSPNAKLQGVITNLSSMKKSKKSKTCDYFDGQLSDETGDIRFHGFDSNVRKTLFEFQQKQCPVALSYCEVQESKYGDGLEVKVKTTSEFQKSDKDIDISHRSMPTVIKELVAITSLKDYSRITVEAKVFDIKCPTKNREGKRLQDLFIADRTHQSKMTLWEDEVGTVEKGKSYRFSEVLVREFKGEKHITTAKQGSCIDKIDDIQDIDITELPESINFHKNVSIIGVEDISSYQACLGCGSQVTEDEDDIGQCGKCETVQRLSETDSVITAKFIVKTISGERIRVHASGNTLLDIMGTKEEQVTAKSLIKSKPFTMKHTGGIIWYVSRATD